MEHEILFTPYELGNLKLKNRLGVAPMTRMSSPGDSIPRQDVLDFLVRRAQNGAAIVYTEAIVTDYESAQGYPGQARLLTQRQIEAWQPIVRAVQAEGAVVIMQMFHCGRQAWPEVNPAGRVIAPSAVTPKQNNPMTGQPYHEPDVMSQFDIAHVINGFVETTKGAMAAGFDGVEVHCAHGYLHNQFLSSYSNRRTDEYGGSLDNRFRIVHETIQAVKAVMPAERLLIARISNWGIADMEVSLFTDHSEWQSLIGLFSNEPLDAISVSTYDFSEPAFGTNNTMAQLTRQATELPIFICGRIYDRKSAAQAIQDADVVLSGKSILLNPNWVEDVRQGKAMEPHQSEDANAAYTDTPLP